MRKLSNLDVNCKLSDDLIISYVLAKNKIPMKVIVNNYYDDQGDLYPFDYGLHEDALHKGSGLGESMENANMLIYKSCLDLLNGGKKCAKGTRLVDCTVAELKDKLRARGLPVSGKKAELVKRLKK